MPRNIEIKARISSVDDLMPKAAAIADSGPVEIYQDDTFFACHSGRLKLRAFSKTEGELIFYRRPDGKAPRESFYILSKTAEPESLRECLSLAYGQAGRVVKHRTLFLSGRTRIHLDRVEGLGHFLELEVVLDECESPESGVREARELMARLAVDETGLVERAYVDMLNEGSPQPS